MYNNSFFKQILLVATIILFASCDKDYNEIGADLIGENHFDFKNDVFSVVAYNQEIGPIQSNNLPVNALGIYENPAFGKTTASFVTQVSLPSLNPTIGANPVVESAVLTIPYYSTLKTTNTDGSHVYELDSIYGASNAKIKLSIYESGYFMRDLDPVGGFQNAQKYYTNQNADFDNLKIGNRLNDFASTEKEQNDKFFFDSAEHVVTSTDATTSVVTTMRTAPGMKLNLNTSFFDSKIVHAAAAKLAMSEAFKEYFRGLYFKVENSESDSGSLAMMNFAKGAITINYKEDLVTTTTVAGVTTSTTTRVDKSIILNLSGNTVSLLDHEDKPAYSTATSTENTTLGDEKLYIKGGKGSMAVISLFGADNFGVDGVTGSPNGVADELDIIRKNGWLINEANLVFNIDAGAMANSYEPQRIYLYDLNNNRPIMDYYTDSSTGTSIKKSKSIFDGNLVKEAVTNGRGLTYKIRITNQIRGLVKNADSTNVKLGVVVTEDINNVTSYKFKNQTGTVKQAPKASVMNPLGTILFGNNIPFGDPNYDKRLKLEIYYTKPN
jgi:hypothetical protein